MKTAEQIVDKFKRMSWDHEYAENGILSVTDAIKAMQSFAAQSVREELTLFHDWFNTLSPADKCTVWPPAGSGSGCGLYNKETSAIIEDFLSKRAKGKIPSPPTNKG